MNNLKNTMLTEDINENPIIVCAADDSYAMPLAVTMCSVIKNLKSYQSILLFIIDGGIKDRNKDMIKRSLDSNKVNIEWIKVTSEIINKLSKLDSSDHLNYTSYLRLLIPKLLPDGIRKAIYLDCDLILRNDISKLWDINIGNNVVLAAQDGCIPELSNRGHVLDWKKCGATEDSKYFNSGVMVINFKKWLEEDVFTETVKFIQGNRRKLEFCDQDALNAVLVDEWGEIDQKWNCILRRNVADKKLNEDAYILHFASNKKPWHYASEKPTKEIFFQYLDMTAWAGWRPKQTLRQGMRKRIENILTLTRSVREKLGLTGWHIKKQQFESALKSIVLKRKFNSGQWIERREELPSLLIALGLNGEGVEVGVWKGIYSQCILYNSYLSKLYSVDPWRKINDDEYVDMLNYSQSTKEIDYESTVSELKKFNKRSKILRMTSANAAKRFENNQLDFVYIDAQHSYIACKEDINRWWSKVKNGGILSGHDYLNGNLPEGEFGVKRAVDEFVDQKNLKLFVTNEAWPTWYLLKK